MLAALGDNEGLRHLDLADNRLGCRAARGLAAGLSGNTALLYLDVSWNHLRPADFRRAARSPLPHHPTHAGSAVYWQAAWGKAACGAGRQRVALAGGAPEASVLAGQ